MSSDKSEKKNQFWDYILRSLTGFGSLALAILFFFFLYNLKGIVTALGALCSILMPLIYGLVIAFVLAPACRWFEQTLDRLIPHWEKEIHRETLIRSLSVGATILLALILVIFLLVLVFPQLFSSIYNLVYSLPGASNRLVRWVEQVLANNPELQSQVLNTYNELGGNALNWVQNTFLPRFQDFVGSLSSGIIGFLVIIKNLIIGIIISVYLLYNRRLFGTQARKLLYSLFPPKVGNHVLLFCRDTNEIFNGFIIGKLLDSMIIGMICFVGCTLLRFPYAILISTIVGVTNVIPYFGPFFGAIPSAVLVLTVSPLQALYFLIFILALQQLDGNVIGPKILGGTTGLSSFWVLISLLMFGGMFGFVGMVIGVPVFAVLYDMAQRGVRYLLRMRHLPQEREVYENIDHVDLKTMEVIPLKKEEKSLPDGKKSLPAHGRTPD